MFQGEEQEVEFIADKSLLDVIFDVFGDKVELASEDGNRVRFKALVQLSPTFFGWCLSFGDKLKVISPEDVVEQLRQHVREMALQYK